jgi:hypothetical protein
MDKQGKMKTSVKVWMTILIIAVIVLAIALFNNGGDGDTVLSLEEKDAIIEKIELASACPASRNTALKLEVQNVLNDASTEVYNATIYLLNPETGGIIETITQTSASPTATNIDCGQVYTLKAVAADADGGDNSLVISILAEPQNGNAVLNDDGTVTFTADRSNMNFKLGMEQHGVLSFKLFDRTQNRFAYNTGSAINTAFSTTGVTFTDGDNTTAFAIASGEFLDLSVTIKGTAVDTDFEDAYVLIGIEAPVDKWVEPSVIYNAKTLEDIKGEGILTPDEATGMNSYEYIYKIVGNMENKIQTLDFFMETCSGCNPTADVEIDMFSAGNYISTTGTAIKTSSHKDDSSKSTVFTKQELTIDVS